MLREAVEIPLLSLRAFYKNGQYVKVIHGQHWGQMGFIVNITDQLLTVYDHQSLTEAVRKEFVVPAHSVKWHIQP
ncbi:hypothetical protein H0H92_015890 [Tricholoma furcatifolium]|nr:hypothetical protein H0H92_015890 [Tricholoma furcatifolium]